MNPNRFLDDFQTTAYDRAGGLLNEAEFSPVIERTVGSMREQGQTASVPGIGHIRTALSRALSDELVWLPRGRVYKTRPYDEYLPPGSSIEGLDDQVTLPYVSRLYCVTDDEHESDSRLDRLLNRLTIQEKNNNVIFMHTLTPKAAQEIFEYQSVTMVAVKCHGGKTFWFTLEPNDNKGKVIPVEAMQSEFGELRDSIGPIDKCPIKAVPVKPVDVPLLQDEIKAVSEMLEKQKPEPEKPISERLRRKLGDTTAKIMQNFGSMSKRT